MDNKKKKIFSKEKEKNKKGLQIEIWNHLRNK